MRQDCKHELTRDGGHPLTLILSPLYLFSGITWRANGARTLVRRKVGWRRGLDVSHCGSAVPAFLRDKSRAPSQCLIRYPFSRGEDQGEGLIRPVSVAPLACEEHASGESRLPRGHGNP
jgi:hypothetical protein